MKWASELIAGYVKIGCLQLLDSLKYLPFHWRYRVTNLLSFLAFCVLPAKRMAVSKNLSLILKRKPRMVEVLKVFFEYGKYWAELSSVTEYWKTSRKIIYGPDFPPCESHFLGLTFHLGNFEVFGSALHPFIQDDFHVIAERLRPQFLADYFTTRRLQHHIKTVPHDNLRQVLRVLKEGKPLGVVCDRVIGGTGIDVRLFGKKIKMPLNIVEYAIQKKIAVYVAYCVHDNGVLKLYSKKVNQNGGFEGVLRVIEEFLEEAIRTYPYQWHLLSAI